MKCPRCGGADSRVIAHDTSPDGAATRRRRKCESCAERWSTVETVVNARRCHDCAEPSAPGLGRCLVHAARHCEESNATGAEFRTVFGVKARRCGVCKGACGVRHNRRTCPLRQAA